MWFIVLTRVFGGDGIMYGIAYRRCGGGLIASMDQLREIIRLSLESSPEKLLEKALCVCIDIAGAQGGSILGEEGPHLQFLFADKPDLIGIRVPFDSIAGATTMKGAVIYTYAPSDKRHFDGIDGRFARETRYLLSIPIPSIHRQEEKAAGQKNAGALQLLFDKDILPHVSARGLPHEFDLAALREEEVYGSRLGDIFRILPNIAFGMEVMKLRQTSYQVIHELKNKLISAISWLDYLRDDLGESMASLPKDSPVHEDFNLVESSVREGADLAKSYLAFTTLYELKREDTDLNAVLKAAAADAAAYAESRNTQVQVELRLDPALPRRSMDPGKLKMAFFNLCKNAVEAMIDYTTPNPCLTVASSIAGETIEVSVADNGPGMPAEIADNLFIPFKTKKQGGTGLGLTITKKIVDIHGGSIACRTKPGGTTFVVTL